jgi:hypothetical protein
VPQKRGDADKIIRSIGRPSASISNIIDKQPLDVGADRIARTAHAALRLLQELRERTHMSIPLAWDRNFKPEVQAIEVYPAGSLKSYGIRHSGYKGNDGRANRAEIVQYIQGQVQSI